MRGHSQLRGAWSEFRDVAHLLTAAAYLAHESIVHGLAAEEASILNSIWLAPDAVLALAYGLQVFGLQPKAIQKEQPILRPEKLWRIPGTWTQKCIYRLPPPYTRAPGFFEFQAGSQKGGVVAKQRNAAKLTR